MKSNITDNQLVEKRFTYYGINGEYFVYDNKENQIPYSYGRKPGTKKQIQRICDELNKKETQQTVSSNEGLENYTWTNGNNQDFVDIDSEKFSRIASIDVCAMEDKGFSKDDAINEAKKICEAVNNYSKVLESLKEVYDLAEEMGMIMTSDQWTEKFRSKFNPIMTKAEFLINN